MRFDRKAAAVALLAGGLFVPPVAAQDPGPDLRGTRALLEQRRYEEALAGAEALLATSPGDPDLLMLRGDIQRRWGQHDRARADYERVVRLRPEDANAWFWLATVDRWSSRTEQALGEFTRAVDVEPCHVEALKGRARVRRQLDDLAGAESDLRAAIACHPPDREAPELLAGVLGRTGRLEEAKAIIDELAEGRERALLLGALILDAEGPRPAAEHYQRALQDAPEDPALQRALADAQQRAGESEAAISTYDRILARDPRDVSALVARADTLRQASRREEARRDYRRLTELRPDHADAWFWLATFDRWDGLHPEAVEEYGRAVAATVCFRDAYNGRARSLISLGKLARAEADLRTSLDCRAEDPEATELLGQLLWKQGRRAEAEQRLRERWTGVELLRRLGDLALAVRHPDQAVAYYRQALLQAPADPALLQRLGRAENDRGRTAAALDAYRRALRVVPEDTGALYWVGVLGTRRGEADEAKRAFKTMLQIKPGNSAALSGLARLARREGDRAGALALVDKALAADPRNVEALVLRAGLYVSQGRRREARADYRAALVIDAHHEEALTGLERLAGGRIVAADASSSRTLVIEGLEDEGLVRDGVPIRPTWIEYLNDGGTVDVTAPLGGTGLSASFTAAREAVFSRGTASQSRAPRRTLYDFDVLGGEAGLDHRLGDSWVLSWRAGGVRYHSRDLGTVPDSDHVRGSAELLYDSSGTELSLRISRSPQIQRGFAQDFDFRVFDREQVGIGWRQDLGGGVALRASAAVARFGDDGDTPDWESLGLNWTRGERVLSLGARRAPFPSRFLVRAPGAEADGVVTSDELRLEFVDLDELTLSFRGPVRWGFRLSAQGAVGRFGATARTLEEDLDGDGRIDRFSGPLERNTHRELRASLSWSPPVFPSLTLQGEYLHDDYDFDTGPYNTTDIDAWLFSAQLASRSWRTFRYALRYERGLISDERRSDYASNLYSARVELRLGRLERRDLALWLVLEALYRDNELDEERQRYQASITIPF